MAKTVFDVLKDKITVEMQAANEHLTSGAANSFAGYRDLCGFIRGLEVALREKGKNSGAGERTGGPDS